MGAFTWWERSVTLDRGEAGKNDLGVLGEPAPDVLDVHARHGASIRLRADDEERLAVHALLHAVADAIAILAHRLVGGDPPLLERLADLALQVLELHERAHGPPRGPLRQHAALEPALQLLGREAVEGLRAQRIGQPFG